MQILLVDLFGNKERFRIECASFNQYTNSVSVNQICLRINVKAAVKEFGDSGKMRMSNEVFEK